MKLPNEQVSDDKQIAVAKYIMDIADKNNAKYHPDDEEGADLVAQLLTLMTMSTTVATISTSADRLMHARGHSVPPIAAWTYFCMITNWLSWAWAENDEPELSEAWGKEWHKINKFSLDNLKGSDLKYYLEKTD